MGRPTESSQTTEASRGIGSDDERPRDRATAVRERVRSLASAAVAVRPESRTRAVRLTAAVAALAGLGPLTITRIVLNSPVVLPSAASGAWLDAVTAGAVVGPALAAVLLGVTVKRSWTRIGLVLVGVFGLLSLASAAAALSAVGAIVVGSWLTLVGAAAAERRDWRANDSNGRRIRTGVVAVALLGGLTLSLFGAVGVRPAALRPAGTTLTLVGMAATPVAFRPRPGAFAVGGLAAGLTFHLTGAAPFVTGAIVLIAGSVVGASAPLLAVAVGGLTATAATGVATRRPAPAAVGLVLLTAGVPSSIPRALGAALAVAFVLAPTVAADGGTSA